MLLSWIYSQDDKACVLDRATAGGVCRLISIN